MRSQLDEAETHVKSLESGRKSSSAKARSNLMKIKSQSHELRKAVMTHTKTIPVKSRAKKVEVVPEVAVEGAVEGAVVKKVRKKKVPEPVSVD
jgi:lipopolysaccharide biosynthesis regulator YciM